MLFEYFLCILAGALTKTADAQVDELIFRKFERFEYALAVLYGLIAGYFLSYGPVFATVALATIVGVLLAGKIDHRAHQAGVATAFISALALGPKPIDWAAFALLLAAAYADEKVSDSADAQGKTGRIERWMSSQRLGMDAMAIFIALLWRQPDYALAVILFDAGYKVAGFVASQNAPKMTRGQHLMIDMFGCDQGKLKSEKAVEKFLSEMPAKIGMHKIGGPFVVRFEPSDPKKKREWGISGVVIIAESHISCHTYPYKATCKVDVYSCREFDFAKTEKTVATYWGSKEYSKKFLMRALDEHLAVSDKFRARRILQAERG